MKDPNRGKYQKSFKHDFLVAQIVMRGYAGTVAWADADYEAFHILAEGARIIAYPHRTSAGNYHVRVRDGGSKDKLLAEEIMWALDIASGNNCRFSQNNKHHMPERLEKKLSKPYGWADQQREAELEASRRASRMARKEAKNRATGALSEG